MYSSVVRESLFIPYIFSLELDSLMIRACAKKKKLKIRKKGKKKKRNDMLMYGISFHWAFMPPFEVHLLGIFVIVGFCEFFQSLSHSCYAFGVSRVYMRVL